MNIENYLVLNGILIASLLFVIYLPINVFYSKDIYYWVPTVKKKIIFFTVLWLIPFIGAFWVHRHRIFRPMRSYKKGSATDGNSISSGFLEIESILNPGAKNQLEAVQEQKVTNQHKAKKRKDYDILDLEKF